jgi:hypothetical protein
VPLNPLNACSAEHRVQHSTKTQASTPRARWRRAVVATGCDRCNMEPGLLRVVRWQRKSQSRNRHARAHAHTRTHARAHTQTNTHLQSTTHTRNHHTHTHTETHTHVNTRTHPHTHGTHTHTHTHDALTYIPTHASADTLTHASFARKTRPHACLYSVRALMPRERSPCTALATPSGFKPGKGHSVRANATACEYSDYPHVSTPSTACRSYVPLRTNRCRHKRLPYRA